MVEQGISKLLAWNKQQIEMSDGEVHDLTEAIDAVVQNEITKAELSTSAYKLGQQ